MHVRSANDRVERAKRANNVEAGLASRALSLERRRGQFSARPAKRDKSGARRCPQGSRFLARNHLSPGPLPSPLPGERPSLTLCYGHGRRNTFFKDNCDLFNFFKILSSIHVLAPTDYLDHRFFSLHLYLSLAQHRRFLYSTYN